MALFIKKNYFYSFGGGGGVVSITLFGIHAGLKLTTIFHCQDSAAKSEFDIYEVSVSVWDSRRRWRSKRLKRSSTFKIIEFDFK